MAKRVPRNTPVVFTCMMRCQPAVSSGSSTDVLLRPALLTSTSSLPKRCTAVPTACSQSASRVTSMGTNTASPPLPRMSASTWRPSSSSTSAMMTLAPSRANSRASSAPMPPPAPLINATLPANRMSIPLAAGLLYSSEVKAMTACSTYQNSNATEANSASDAATC